MINEKKRLEELHNLQILDTGKEARFDRFTALAANLFNAPVVLISLIDANRQWFKSCFGVDIESTPRSISLCSHAIEEEEILVVPDLLNDIRFATNPVVAQSPKVRFYAGAVLKGPTGQPLGTICVIDLVPRDFSERDQALLIQIARLIEHEIYYSYHLNEMREKVETSLFYDAQTGIPNRRLFRSYLVKAIEDILPQQKIIVIALKINQFDKMLNRLGESISYDLLNDIFTRLTKNSLESEAICRWEDDTFLLFATINHNQPSSLINIIENIFTLFLEPFRVKNENQVCTCNLGVSVFPTDSVSPDQLISNAIYAMRLESSHTKNSYNFYSDDLTKKVSKEYEMERMLIKTLAENALDVAYQPKFDLRTGKICGVEALCRWHNEEEGDISPVEFIHIAENADLIIKLGEWVLKKACQQNKDWQAMGLSSFPISVNVSRKQILKKDFVYDVIRILSETSLKTEFLDLEITESSLIDFDDALTNINFLNKMGVSLSLDDFGTGFSSLSYIQQIPLKALKIDKSFIDNLVTNEKDRVMVKTIIAMAKSINLICIAEGVETVEQLILLKEMQCDQIQGFLLGKPLTADEFTKLMKDSAPQPA